MSSKLLIVIAVTCFFACVSPSPVATGQEGKKRPRVESEAVDISGDAAGDSPRDDRKKPSPRSAPKINANVRAKAASDVLARRRTGTGARNPTPIKRRVTASATSAPAERLYAVTIITEAPQTRIFSDNKTLHLAGADSRVTLRLKGGYHLMAVAPPRGGARRHAINVGHGSTIHYLTPDAPTILPEIAPKKSKKS